MVEPLAYSTRSPQNTLLTDGDEKRMPLVPLPFRASVMRLPML